MIYARGSRGHVVIGAQWAQRACAVRDPRNRATQGHGVPRCVLDEVQIVRYIISESVCLLNIQSANTRPGSAFGACGLVAFKVIWRAIFGGGSFIAGSHY